MKASHSDPGFIQRKEEHIQFSLLPEAQSDLGTGLDQIELIHDSLPDLNLNEISIESEFMDETLSTPFFVSGMTAGHENAQLINERIAFMASERGWIMGLGSQRRELDENFDDQGLQGLSVRYPQLRLISNIGISQLIELYEKNDFSPLLKLLEKTHSILLAIHLNPIQEAIQTEGTPRFKGGWKALRKWLEISPVPVVVKETGSGMSESTLLRLSELNLFAVDVSGMGGTHWGRIEGLRAKEDSPARRYGKTFENWGISTAESLHHARKIFKGSKTEIWSSGGIRNGLDAAKSLALGAKRVGFAKPILEQAVKGEAFLMEWAEGVEKELKIALFCTNSRNLGSMGLSKLKGVE